MTSWMHAVSALPLAWMVPAILVVSGALSWVVISLIRRWMPHPVFKENNEFVGFTYAVFGLIYGVLLAFTIITAWERFTNTEQVVMHEATILSKLWRYSEAFSPKSCVQIQHLLIDYAQSVITDEWPEMARRGQAHPLTRQKYEAFWKLSYSIQPETGNQGAFFAAYLEQMSELSSARRLRIMFSRSEVNPILLVVIFAGALPTIAYTMLFTTKHGWVHILVTSFISGLIGLSLLVLLSLQYPFTGDVRIAPDAIQTLLNSIQERISDRN